jgi:hypothetical protein
LIEYVFGPLLALLTYIGLLWLALGGVPGIEKKVVYLMALLDSALPLRSLLLLFSFFIDHVLEVLLA